MVINGLLLSKGVNPSLFATVVFDQPQTAKKTIHILLHHLSQTFLNHLELEDSKPDTLVSAAAAVIQEAVGHDEARKSHLINWCASSSGAGLGDGIAIRRAVLAVLAQDKEAVTTVFERIMSQFGDELYIKHAAILQQDGKALFIGHPIPKHGS